MSLFPSDKKKIKERISRYERELKKEYQKFKFISDGYGKRYMLGPMYLMIGDIEGAQRSFKWFEKKFPNDSGEPFHYLCWTLTYFKLGDLPHAKSKLLQTVLSNLYIIPMLLGIPQERLDIYHASNFKERDYVFEEAPELFDLWDDEALVWLKETYESKEIQQPRTRYIEIYSQLQDLRPGSKRSRLIDEAYALRIIKPLK